MKKIVLPLLIAIGLAIGCKKPEEKQCDPVGFWFVTETSLDGQCFDSGYHYSEFFILLEQSNGDLKMLDSDPGLVHANGIYKGCNLHLEVEGLTEDIHYNVIRDYVLSGTADQIVEGNSKWILTTNSQSCVNDFTADGIKVTSFSSSNSIENGTIDGRILNLNNPR